MAPTSSSLAQAEKVMKRRRVRMWEINWRGFIWEFLGDIIV
jgi:hypothetical protein